MVMKYFYKLKNKSRQDMKLRYDFRHCNISFNNEIRSPQNEEYENDEHVYSTWNVPIKRGIKVFSHLRKNRKICIFYLR